jgi:hypothetical protein
MAHTAPNQDGTVFSAMPRSKTLPAGCKAAMLRGMASPSYRSVSIHKGLGLTGSKESGFHQNESGDSGVLRESHVRLIS